MAFRDWLKEYRESQSSQGTAPATSTPKVTNTAKSTTTTDKDRSGYKFSDWLKEYREVAPTVSLQGWAETSINLINDVQKNSGSWYDDNEYQSRSDRFTTLLSQADNWRKQYSGNAEAVSYINSVVDALSQAQNISYDYRKYYSKWNTREEYDTAVRQDGYFKKYDGMTAKDIDTTLEGMEDGEEKEWLTAYKGQVEYDEMLNFDLDLGQREVDELEGVLEEYDRLILQQSTANPNSDANVRLSRIVATYGSKAQIKDLLARKKAYLTQAQRAQEGVELSGVADEESELYDPEFKAHSGYVSTQADGLWGKLTSQYGMGYDDLTYEYINGANNGMREEILDKDRAYHADDTSDSTDKWKIYDHMTEDEIAIYNYYYAKDGKEAAENYLGYIQESLNARAATERFEGSLKGNTGLELLFSLEAGLDQFESGLKNFFNFSDDYIPYSTTQQLSGKVREDLKDDGFMLPDWMGGASLGQAVYDTGTTTANMLPSILVSLVPGAGQVLGTASMGVSAAGNAYQEMLNLGYSKGQSRLYSALVGGSEAGLQYLLGGIGKLGGVADDAVTKTLLSHVDNALGRVAIQLGANALSEGFEEGLQEVLTPWFQSIAFGLEANVNWSDVMYSSLLGALTANIFEGGGTISENVGYYRTGKKLQSAGFGADALSQIGNKFSPDTVAYQLAGKVNENTGAYTIGRMFHEIGASMTEQNVRDITQNLVGKGMREADARKLAQAISAIMDDPTSVTSKQMKLLDANDVLASAVIEELIDPNTTYYQRQYGYEEALRSLADSVVAEGSTTATKVSEAVMTEAKQIMEGEQKTGSQVEESAVSAMEQALKFSPFDRSGMKFKSAAMSMYDPASGVEPVEYAKAARQVYEQGLEGKTMKASKELDQHQAEMAYAMGQIASGREVQTVKATVQAGQENVPAEGSLTVSAENGSQSRYESSVDGKTTMLETGEEVSIKEIAAIEDGQMILMLEDGSEVNADDVSYASQDQALVYETVANMGVNASAANVLVNAYHTGGVSAPVYAQGIQEAYRYGQYNYPVQELSDGPFSSMLTDHQRNTAYNLGKMFGDREASKAQATVAGKKATGGKVVGKVHFDGDRNSLTERQSASLSAMEKIAEALGVQIYVFESPVDSRGRHTGANGWYDPKDGSIHIDLHAGVSGEATMLFTVSHELVHFIKQWSPAKFKTLANFLMQEYGKKGVSVETLVQAQIAKAKRNGRTISYDTAYEEVIADSMEIMLSDGNVMEKLAKLKQQDKSLWQKIKDFITDLCAKIRKVYEGLSPDSVEGRYVAEMKDAIESLQELFTEGLVDASENYQASLTPGKEGTVFAENGEAVAHSTEDGTIQLSMRTYDEEGRAAFRDYLNKCVSSNRLTKAEMQEMLDGIEEIYRVCQQFKDKYAPFGTWSDAAVVRDTYGKPVFSVVTPNGEYKMNLDFSLVCKKRRTLDAVFNEMAKRGIIDDFELGQKSVVKINEIIRKHGFETACALCFVDAKRFRQAAMADSFTRLYNELVLSLVPESQRGSIGYFNFSGYETIKKVEGGIDTWDASKLDFSHIDEVLKTYGKGTVEYKSARYIKTHTEARKLLLRGDFMSSKGFDAVKTQNTSILKLYNSKKGTGGPKAAFGDVQYLNEIIKKARTWTPAKAYAVGGVRIQSFSDYVPRMVFDYVQMVYDLAATKLPAHAYTKEALFAKQFGLTGIKINMSLIPAIAEGGIAAGLDANGNYVWAGESFDFETAKQIQSADGYTENCGTICVGVSDLHIRKLLNDPDIRMVIPYHKSGLNPIVAHMNRIAQFTDYTGSQNTLDRKGSKVAKDFDFSKALHDMGQHADPRAVISQYLEWCDKNGYTPKFSQFRDHPNYYKLIEDFTLFDANGHYVPQREVRAVFPKEGDAFGSMKSLIEAGLQEDAVIEGKRDADLSSVVDEIQKTLPRTEAEIAETQVEQADRDLEADVKLSGRDYAIQVEDVKNNTHDPNNHVYMGVTPTGIAKVLDLPKLPMLITSQHIYSMAVSEAQAKLEKRFKPRYNYHNLGWDVVKKIPEYINKPVLIIKSNTDPDDATFVVVTAQVDNDGNPIIAAVKPNGRGNYFNIEFPTNFMLSGYGKDGIQGYVARAKTENRILYANKNSQKTKNTTSVQFADNILSSDYSSNLAQFKRIVKSMFEGTIFENSGLPKFSDRDTVPTFYSHMARVVDGVKQDKLGAASVVSMLRGKGVKAEEIKWSGIETFLEGKKSVTKAELQEFIAGSMLQIDEEVLADEEIPYTQEQMDQIAKYEAERATIAENLKSEWKRIVGTDIPITYFGAGLESAVVQNLLEANATKKGETEAGYQYKAKRAALQRVIEDGDHYFGFDNARQALREAVRNPKDFMKSYEMTSFEESVFKDFIKAKEAYSKVEGISVQDQKALKAIAESADRFSSRILKVKNEHRAEAAKYLSKYRSYTIKGGTNYRELLFRLPGATYSNNAMDVHWERAGVLAHARIQDLNTFLGKMLFIEEIQSDWHNEGHKSGYEDVPDAPFRDNYHEYVLKRLIRMAAEEGYDSIGWTTADIQSDRWSDEFAEGYRIEYDQDIPKFLRKYGKKWGTTVGKTVLDSGTEVWSMAITDSMQESVMTDGQPLYSDRDSDGNLLSAEQQEFFRESKVRDEQGRLVRVYHGTDNGGFTVFKTTYSGEAYWFADRVTANTYADFTQTDDSTMLYEVYLNAKNPLIIDADGYRAVSIPTDIFASDGGRKRLHHIDDIAMYALDNGYDGLIVKNVKDYGAYIEESLGVDGDYDLKPGTVYAVFNPDQVKNVDNTAPTSNPDIRFQDRTDESVSSRSLLANAFEGVAQNDIERQKIQEYKGKIALIEAEERKLRGLNEQIKELSFARGPRDTDRIRQLQFEATQTANRINTYDRQLLRLEASKPLQAVLDREKKMAYKRAEQRGKEALAAYRERAAKTQRGIIERYQESRKKGIESREKTAIRHKIKDVVSELNQYLLRGTKDRHVPIELQKAVAEALDAVNMDTVGAEERIAKLKAELLRAKTPEQIQEISRKIDNIQAMGDKMSSRLKALKDAYDQFVNSDDPLIANSHDEVISAKLQSVIESVGDTPLRDMTLSQLEDVYDMYRMVLTTIRNANKAFKAAKSESIAVLANQVMMEVERVGGKKKYRLKGTEGIESFDWNNQKPVYAFERIGSGTLTEVFNNVRAGEDVWATDVTEAREYYLAQSKKHDYDSWDFKKRYKFTSSSGMDFELSVEQIMSLYAYSKREQAAEHLKRGGIVFDETTEVTMKSKLGIPLKFNPTEATAYNISDETLADIISKLTKEQRAFVDEMQDYLSTTMGAKGNEVSLALYGIKLFKEKFYFPLRSATQFMAKAKEQQQGEVKIKNSGFSKETVQKASNPIVLTPFMDVWANHVNEMSMYHAFVLPMEDFYRVYNYKTPTSDTMATESVEMFIQNAYGKAATKYIDQLLKDLNGGAVSDPRETPAKMWTSRFKKAAVMASLSVVVQQPTAIVRAMALVDAKYFGIAPITRGIVRTVNAKKHRSLWAEVKKYAPVAVIKEMGHFDTNMGRSTQDFIKAQEYRGLETVKGFVTDSAYRDEKISRPAALADEMAWVAIWEAVKRETVSTHKNLRPGSEEFLEAVGKRFTEVVTKTQVYDSVLAKSANMRSKGLFMNMWTSFMAEPTTSINMLQDALVKAKRGDKRYAAKAIGAVYGSVILNAALVSLVYAMRDDDEDETFTEKYLSRLTTEILDGINPMTYIPFLKDVWSIMQGFDIERSDMSLITDLVDSLQQAIKVISTDTDGMDEDELAEHQKKVSEALWSMADNIASIAGIPLKNVRRDLNGTVNLVETLGRDIKTTGGSLKDTILGDVKDSIPVWGWFPDESKADKLYDAIVSGDTVYVERLKAGYKDESAYNTAVRKALRDNDPRIREAAEAAVKGDPSERVRIAKEIIAEGHFSQDNVVAAINAEINAISKDETNTTSSTPKASGLYKAEDFALEIANGDQAAANAAKVDIIQTAVKNGKTQDEAEKSFASSAKSELKELFLAGDISEQEIIQALTTYCGETEDEAMADVQYWAFKQDYPDVYADDSWFDKYYEEVADSGIEIDVYMGYCNQVKDITGEGKKEKRMAVIHSLPITNAQKDALYYAEGWAASKLYEAPWH